MFRRFPRPIDWLAFGVLLFLPSALALRPILAGAIPDFMDPVMYFFPMRWHAAHLAHDGQFPWWSRSILTGVPLFANPQSALAYPPTALMLAWPSGTAYTAPLLFHLGLFAASTYALLRRTRAGFAAALMGGGLCLAGSYGWTRLQMGNYMNILPWWPLWGIALLGFLRSPGSPALTGGALAVAMMILGGAHQLAVYGALGLGLLVLPFCFARDGRTRAVVFIAVTALLGLAIAAPGWLPQLAFLRETERGQVLDPAAVLVGTLASPLQGIRQLAGGASDAGASISVGAFALLVAGAVPAAGVRRWMWTGAWAGAAVTFLLAWRPVAGFALDTVPGFGAFHDPKRILGVTQWLLIVAAALGADGWIGVSEETFSRRFLRLVPAFALGGLLIAAQWGTPLSPADAAIPAVLLYFLVFLFWPRTPTGADGNVPSARTLAAAPFLVTAVALVAWDTRQSLPFDWRPASELAGEGPPALLKRAELQPGERFFVVDWKRDSSYDFRRPDLRDSALPNLAMLWNLEDVGGYEPARTPRYNRWLAAAAPWPGHRQPWSGHFGLPFPPYPDSPAVERFGEANPRALLAPRWGVPVYLVPVEERRLGGWAPAWNPDIAAHLLYRPDAETRAARRLTVIDVLGSRHAVNFDPESSRPAMTPLITAGVDEAGDGGLELDSSVRAQAIDLERTGASAPLAGIEIELLPAEHPAWLFLWSESFEKTYVPVETRGIQMLLRPHLPGNWAEVRGPDGAPSRQGRVLARSIEVNRLDLDVEWNGTGPGIVEIHDAWWPGWKARVNGQAAEVRPSGPDGEGLWRWIEVPAGKSSLILTYEPPGLRGALTLCSAGLALLLLSGWLIDRRRVESGDGA